MPELWQPIEGYEGLYEVSDQGRVKSLERRVYAGRGRTRVNKEKLLSSVPIANGYLAVNLRRKGKSTTHYVHRLVATAFMPGSGELTVDHIDGNKLNNCLDNLQYLTRSDNIRKAWAEGKYAKRLRAA